MWGVEREAEKVMLMKWPYALGTPGTPNAKVTSVTSTDFVSGPQDLRLLRQSPQWSGRADTA